jgi:hypothetical protein
MNIFDIIIIVLLILYPFISKFVERYFVQKGENIARIEDSREIQYEIKKGENLATKEDIEEITKQIETVKSEISFENQRKHEFINQRTNRLLEILFLTEKLNEYQNILMFTLYDKNSSIRLLTLIEQINETLLKFTHECRIVFVTVHDEDLTNRITTLIKNAQDYSTFMCYIASNASSHLVNWKDYLDIANKYGDDKTILNKAIESQEKVASIREEFEEEISKKQKVLYDSQIKYMSKLNLMFGSDFHLKSDN